MAQTPKEKADQMFGDKYNIIRPLIQDRSWQSIREIVLNLCIDDVENILLALDEHICEKTHKFYKDVKEVLYNY